MSLGPIVAELTCYHAGLGAVSLSLKTGIYSEQTAISALLRRWMAMYEKPERERTVDEQAVMTKQIVLQSDEQGNLGQCGFSAPSAFKEPNILDIVLTNKDTHELMIIPPEGTNLFVKAQFRASVEAEWQKKYPNAPVAVGV